MIAGVRQVKTCDRMERRPSASSTDAILSALDWWREAGVDLDFDDDATAWLAEPAVETKPDDARPAPRAKPKRIEPETPAPPKQFGGPAESWPVELAEFQQWWLSEPGLDAGGTGPRIIPSGKASPRLMVFVPEPEAEDAETLLSGREGRLLDGFLRAARMDEGAVYRASILPRAVPLADWQSLQACGIGKLVAHHIELVRPQRIIVFGRNILPLIGHATAQDSAVLREFNHEGRSVPVMGCRGLADLLRSATGRRRLWQRWLDWTDGKN